jgi:adenine-specific DNA-methyltransferase
VTPGAIAFADYAAPLMEEFRKRFAHVEILHVEGPIRWNGYAQERAALVLASGYGCSPAQSIFQRTMLLDQRRPARPPVPAWSPRRAPTEFGQIAKLEIGLVTGANDVFLLDRLGASENRILDDDLRPIIARARHARGLMFTSEDALALASEGEKTLLIYPVELGPRNGPVRLYLARIPKRRRLSVHWFSRRNPWWRVQLGRPCDAVFTYMNSAGPRLTLTGDGVTCTNTLHRVTFIDCDRRRMQTACVSMLSTYTQLEAERIGRIYGGGVLKFELKDARRLPLLLPEKPISRAIFARIDTALRAGALEKARMVADEAVMPEFFGSEWREPSSAMAVELASLRARRGVSLRQFPHPS